MTFVEELTVGLVGSGVGNVLFYYRRSYFRNRPSKLYGARLVYLPAPRF